DGERLLLVLVADDDETHGFERLGTAGHSPGLEDAMEDVVGDRTVVEGAGVALAENGFVDGHAEKDRDLGDCRRLDERRTTRVGGGTESRSGWVGDVCAG